MANNAKLNRMVTEIKKLEIEKKQLEDRIAEIKNDIKFLMYDENVDEFITDKFVIRNKPVLTNRFDTKRFKTEHDDLYTAYLVESYSERFTIK